MNIEFLRDLVIVIDGFLLLLVLIIFTILVLILFKHIVSIVRSVRTVTRAIEDTVNRVNELSNPVLKLVAMFTGVRNGINAVMKVFKKRRRKKDERRTRYFR